MIRVGLYARDMSRWGKGVGEYVREMVRALLQRPSENIEYLVIAPELDFEMPELERAEIVLLPDAHGVVQDHLHAGRIMNGLRLDAAWFPKNTIPLGFRGKSVVSFLDLAYFMPEYKAYPVLDRVYMRRMFRRSAKQATHIAALSETTRDDTMRILGVDPDRLSIVYPGVNESYRPITENEQLVAARTRYGLSEPFIFYAGGISPRKNLVRLLEAFSRVKDEMPHHLVITGWVRFGNHAFERAAAGLEGRVHRLGRVPVEDMPALYTLASVYAHPSLYEGFGISVIEAQACGTPVLNSNAGCMPEVAGDGALYVDPYDADEMADGLRRLVTDASLREDRIAKGRANAARFRWDESAARLEHIFHAVAAGDPVEML
jgi:glycosyltransferase involved in cell wall biosynthesis